MTVIPVQITATDAASETGTETTDEFDLLIENVCLEDEVNWVGIINDYVYYIDEDTTAPDFPNMGP